MVSVAIKTIQTTDIAMIADSSTTAAYPEIYATFYGGREIEIIVVNLVHTPAYCV